MKKILVVLLAFAVAGGLFAQWSVDGNAHLESVIDFYNTDKNDPAWIDANRGIEDGSKGELNLMYQRDGLSAGFTFHTGDGIMAKMVFEGKNYYFAAMEEMHYLLRAISGYDAADDLNYAWGINKLEGTYALLNGILNFHAAFRSGEYDWWLSDKTALSGYNYLFNRTRVYSNLPGAGTGNTVVGANIEDGFAKVDGNNFFKVDISFSALNAGIILPNAFYWGANSDTPISTVNKNDFYKFNNDEKYIGTVLSKRVANLVYSSKEDPFRDSNQTQLEVMEGVLKMAIFGVSFDMNPIDFALQLAMEDFGAYLGVGFKFNERMKLGVSFAGMFANWYETNAVGGLSFDFNLGAFGAGVKLWYGVDGAFPKKEKSTIGVEPSFFFNIIPTHFRFYVDGLFAINAGDIHWRFAPEITWNFRGQGAGEWGDIGTGFLVRLKMEKEDVKSSYYLSGGNQARGESTLLFAFKWNFF